jgi:alpha-glucosidase
MTVEHVPLRDHPVLYEVYVRSFSDSNGDGIGDIRGITSKLDYLQDLGIDGIWLTPIFESPQFDFGYDVSDYYAIHSEYGTLSDVEEMIRESHARGMSVVFDIILGHTSVKHSWFRSHPLRYIWSESIPNNWVSVFGGSAWAYDETRRQYYYHRFYKEQPHLDWNSVDVRAAMHQVLKFWIDKGVDGFRLDSIDGLAVDPELRDEPPASMAKLEGRENDAWAEFWSLDHIYTSNLPQAIEEVYLVARTFPGTSFFVEADLPTRKLRPYMATGASAFAFDFMRAPLDGSVLAGIIDGAGADGSLGWALSNHDQPRLVSRWGRKLASVAATLLLSLPGCSFIYQGDEIGMMDGRGGPITFDRAGRDSVRHPMQWTADGGFTTGVPWLPMSDPEICNVSNQLGRPGSMLEMYRSLIRVRHNLTGAVKVIYSDAQRLVFRRGNALVDLNLSEFSVNIHDSGKVIFATNPVQHAGVLAGHSAVILRSCA